MILKSSVRIFATPSQTKKNTVQKESATHHVGLGAVAQGDHQFVVGVDVVALCLVDDDLFGRLAADDDLHLGRGQQRVGAQFQLVVSVHHRYAITNGRVLWSVVLSSQKSTWNLLSPVIERVVGQVLVVFALDRRRVALPEQLSGVEFLGPAVLVDVHHLVVDGVGVLVAENVAQFLLRHQQMQAATLRPRSTTAQQFRSSLTGRMNGSLFCVCVTYFQWQEGRRSPGRAA